MNTVVVKAINNTDKRLVEVDDRFICYNCNEIGPVDKKFAHIETVKHKYYKSPVRMFVKANSDPELSLKQMRKALNLSETSNAYVKIMLKESLPFTDGEYIESDIVYFHEEITEANKSMHFFMKSEGDKTFPFTVTLG